jgi:hypothetical protein
VLPLAWLSGALQWPGRASLEQYRFCLNRVAINKAMKLLDKIWLEQNPR